MKDEQLTVVVTGGSGYIGRVLCEKLVTLDYNVVNIDRNKKEIPGVTQYPFELNNSQIKGIMALLKPHAVIHLASENPHTNPRASTSSVYQVNVADTITLLNYAVAAGVQYFVMSGYTDCVSEIDVAYTSSKQIVDQLLPQYAAAYGVKYASLKYPVVAGVAAGSKDTAETHITRIVRNTLKGITTEAESVSNKYIHVIDVAEGHISALNHIAQSDSGVIQLAPKKTYTDVDIADIAQQQLRGAVVTPSDPVLCDKMQFQLNYNIHQIVNHTLVWVKKHK